MLSTLLSGILRTGLPAAAPHGGGGKDGEELGARKAAAAATAEPPQQRQRPRRASGSFTGDSAPAASPSAPARRPLVIEWPQVKAFLAMADASLKRKTEQVEVGEKERREVFLKTRGTAAAATTATTKKDEREKEMRFAFRFFARLFAPLEAL